MFQSLVNMRGTESSSLDSVGCVELSLVETDEENSDIETLSACTVQGCILETDAVKSGSNAQNAAKWRNEERSGTDNWTTLLCFFCNNE